MSYARISAVLTGTILLSGLLFAQQTEIVDGKEVAGQQVLLKFRPGLEARLADALSQHDIDRSRRVGRDGVFLLHSRSRGVARLLQELRQSNYVQYVEPDFVVRANAVPNDPSFNMLWGLRNTGQSILGVPGTSGNDIGAVQAWDVSTGSSSVVVGIVDTGIDYNHQDLQANIWSAPTQFTVTINGVQITCPAGSHGYNAIANSCNPMDDRDHGTHVAGTIGARGNNSLGVAGVNWNTSMMALKFLGSNGQGLTSDAIEAIEFAIQAKAIFGAAANVRILSNSWGGGGFSQALLDEINKAAAADMLFVAAAGNGDPNTGLGVNNDVIPTYPANYDAANIIAVAAIDNQNQLASFSNYGRFSVDLGAPGVSVLSTIRNNTYDYYNGTSMATPHVSGAAALVLSACSLNTAALKQLLLSAVVPSNALTFVTVTSGRLNVNNAIRACAGVDFSLSASPASQTVNAGGGTSYSIGITPISGFAGAVTFSVTGLPSGAGGSFSPNPSSATASTLTVTTGAATPGGSYPLTITGVSGSLSHTTSATLVVNAVAGVADLTIAKSHSGNFTQGQTGATYTMTVTNSGSGPTSGTVTVTDTLPAGLTATAISGNGWSCTLATLVCTRSNALAAGASYSAITLTVTVSASAPASVTNAAGVAGGGETNTANNNASDITTIVPAAGASTKTIWAPSVVPANVWQFDFPGTFGLKFRSDVAGSVTGIRFYKGASNTGSHVGLLYNSAGALLAQATFTGETASGWQQVNFPEVAINANTTYVAAFWSSTGYAVNQGFFGSSGVDNPPLHALQYGVDGGNGISAYGSAPAFPTSGFSGNNYWVDVVLKTGAAPAVPDLTITKSHSGSFTRGQVGATYSLVVRNSGTGATSGTVSVSDSVPAGLTATAISGSGWACSAPAGPCTRNDALASGASYPAITLTVTVLASAASTVTNTASVSGGGETNTGNNTASDPTNIVAAPVPDLIITKSHTGNFTQGQAGATYTIIVTNSGSAATTGMVSVSDTLPSGLTATSIAGTGWTCTQPAGACTRSNALAAGASYPSITLTVSVSASAPASLTNIASVTGGGETNTANNSASDVTTILPTGGGGTPKSIWTASAVPAVAWQFDFPGTFGVKFRSDVAGSVTGIRFYKGAGNTGGHIGLLYNSAGTLLAQATFTGETASGWQQVNFPGVVISPNTTYIAAFWSSSGYAVNNGFFASGGVDNPPLHALAYGVDGANGLSSYGSSPSFPSTGFFANNFWVDVVFTPQ